MKLTLSNLWLKRGDKHIFRNLNLSFSSDRITILKGANGCGKTSLLKLIAGLLQPQRGKLTWQEPIETPPIHFLSHKVGMSLNLTPFENWHFALSLKGFSFRTDQARNLLETYKLASVQDQQCQKLSQGERRKVALIEVILAQRPVWLLDEPFSVLDKNATEQFCQHMKEHQAKGGLVILSSHQPLACDFLEIDVGTLSASC